MKGGCGGLDNGKLLRRDEAFSIVEHPLRWEIGGGSGFGRVGDMGMNPNVCLSSLSICLRLIKRGLGDRHIGRMR